MSYEYTQKITPSGVDRDTWPEWARARHLLERLRPYFLYEVVDLTGATWAKSWSVSEKKGTLTLKCKDLTAEEQEEARQIVDQINAALAQLRVACPIRIQTDAPSVALGLFDLMA